VKINVEKGNGPSVKSQFGVSGLPTIKILNTDLQEVGGFVGYQPISGVLSSMNQARGG
jgi:thioredoxin-like negative regulator of GroEL